MTAPPETYESTPPEQLDSGRTGTILSINVSNGGVPKKSVNDVQVSRSGLVGDAHSDFIGHGGPERAVCIYPIELIRSLRQEGHPVDVGTTGENLTVEGIDWEFVVPGARIRCGEAVELEVASFTSPCKTIRESFIEGEFTRISQKVNPGWSRVYARVLSEGKIRRGDAIRVIPPGV